MWVRHAVNLWGEVGDNSGKNRVGDNKAASSEHEGLLPANGVEDESNEAGEVISWRAGWGSLERTRNS